MMSKTILIFSLLTITSALLHAQKVVYNQNGLSLQIRSTLTKSYRHKNIQGQDEDRYIWQVEARLNNANAVPVYLHGFYIKRTVKCFEGTDDPFRSDCRKGTVLENMPVVLPAKDSKLISGCFDTNCPENLDIDWWISDWILKSRTTPKNIPAQNGLSTFESASSNGFDPATWAVMTEAKKLYEKVDAESPQFTKPQQNINDRFASYRFGEWYSLLNYARAAEQDRRWALMARKNGNLPCVKYHILNLRAALMSYKSFLDFLQAVNWDSPSALNHTQAFVDENIEKYHYSKQRSEGDPLKAKANKILEEVQGCPVKDNILEEWNEADYAPISQPGSWINPSVEPEDTSSPSSPDVANAKSQPSGNTSKTAINANNSAGKDTPSKQTNPKAAYVAGGQTSSNVETSVQPTNTLASASSSGSPDKSAPTDYNSNFNAAKEAAYKNDHRKVIDYLTTAIKAQPTSSDAYYQRGNTYGYLNQYDQALADYNQAESLGNRTASLYQMRAATNRILHNPDAELADLTKAISAAPQDKKAFYYRLRGQFYEKLVEYPKAFADYTQVLRLEPQNRTAIEAIARIRPQIKDSDITASASSSASTDSQDQQADKAAQVAYTTNFNAGKEASFKSDYSKAIEYLTEAIKLQPNSFEAYFQRGTVYSSLRQYSQALSDYNKSESLGNNTWGLYFNRSSTNKMLANKDDAIADLSKAILVVPQEKKAMYHRFRGLLYKEFGQLQNALDDYNQSLRLEPNNSIATKEVELLKKQLTK